MKTIFGILALICALVTSVGAQSEGTSVWTGDQQKLYEHLKAEGCPDNIIFAVLVAKDKAAMDPQRVALLYPKGLTRIPMPPAKVTGGQVNDLYDEGRLRIRTLMGSSLDTTIARIDTIQMVRWGDLSDIELVNVKRVYEACDTLMAHNRPYNGTLDPKVFEWDERLDAEFSQRIRQALGSKADDFLTFNSFLSRRVAIELANGGIEVDETTFGKLVAETRKLRHELASVIKTIEPVQGGVAKLRMYQSILGDEKGLAVLKGNVSAVAFDKLIGAVAGTR